jgi:hypothetical protein
MGKSAEGHGGNVRHADVVQTEIGRVIFRAELQHEVGLAEGNSDDAAPDNPAAGWLGQFKTELSLALEYCRSSRRQIICPQKI